MRWPWRRVSREPPTIGDPVEALKARWIAEKTKIFPGATPEALDAFEARYGVVLPGALRGLFQAADGMDPDEMDSSWSRFLPLDEFVPIRDHQELGPRASGWTGNWFIFADYLVGSYAYLVRLSPDPADGGQVAFWDFGEKLYEGTPIFAVFLDRYLADPDRPIDGDLIEG